MVRLLTTWYACSWGSLFVMAVTAILMAWSVESNSLSLLYSVVIPKSETVLEVVDWTGFTATAY